jgi:hypothetical protein
MFRVEQKFRQIKLITDLIDRLTDDLILCSDPIRIASMEHQIAELRVRYEQIKLELIEAAQNL